MKTFVVITTIFPPTDAVRMLSQRPTGQVVVVGDKKTPQDWHCEHVEYLSVERQNDVCVSLREVLPFNHYCRKMTGYLYAIAQGAEYIIDTDDDNIPKPHWSFPDSAGVFSCTPQNRGFVNIYELYTPQKIWPRGLPLNLIATRFDLDETLTRRPCKVGVWQGLADEDPDVDAVYRLTGGPLCFFAEREPIVLGEGTISPFNSQNTQIHKDLFALLYLPTHVTFRFTDILRGLVAQPILWLFGYQLGFTNATVVQKRNPHDYMADFISEIPMYRYCERAVAAAGKVVSTRYSIEENLFNVYDALRDQGIVEKEEMDVLSAWLEDLDRARTCGR
ncbi:MAG: STELLO glycosyltransferase family protein [Phycisphaerales bacterium]